MIKVLAPLLALAAHSAPALAQVSYAGSSTIGEHIIPEAAKMFTAKTSEARFSHGICPECKEKYVTPEIRRRREEAP